MYILFVLIIFFKTFNPKKRKKKKEKIKSKKSTNDINHNTIYKKKKRKLTKQELKEKGDLYERYVSNYFKNQGYISYEHGLEKGYQDKGIDLIVKKDKEYLFVQCKNWDSWKLNKKNIVNYRTKIKNYMLENKQQSRLLIDLNYDLKLIFISPNDIYSKEAKQYIKENKHIIEYKILPIKE